MKKAVLSTFCLILVLSLRVFAQGQSVLLLPDDSTDHPKFQADWRVSMMGLDSNDVSTQSKLVDFSLDLRSLYYLNSSLFLDFQPTLRFASGQYESFDGADKEDNKLILHQAAVHYKPSTFFSLSVGALNQRTLHTSLLMDDLAFPAARLESDGSLGSWNSGVSIESAIPTSTSLSTNTNSVEATPSLNTASVRVNWVPQRNLYWKNSFGYFQYNNLPSAVAQGALLLGNDVNQISDADYAFVYKFQGLEAHSEFKFPVSVVDLGIGAEYVENQSAPSPLNTAYKFYSFTSIPVTKGMDVTFKATRFAVAPDAVVAYFNAWDYEANREGYSLEGSLHFKKEKFNVSLKYTDADVMYINPNQSQERILFIRLETFYADI